jgi:hypothetical protein
MEEIENFDDWVNTVASAPIEYYAIYNSETGEVTGIYPGHAANNKQNKVLITQDFAEDVFAGIVSLHSCFVDDNEGELQVVQTQSVKKIDDILHRVISQEFTENKEADLYIHYYSTDNILMLSLDEKIKNKKIKFNNDTELKFFITEYNDPYKIIQLVSTTLNNLYKESQKFYYTGTTKKFSVFTSRIFKNYIFIKQ